MTLSSCEEATEILTYRPPVPRKILAINQRVHVEENWEKFSSVISHDQPTRPDGTRDRLLDIARLAFEFSFPIGLNSLKWCIFLKKISKKKRIFHTKNL